MTDGPILYDSEDDDSEDDDEEDSYDEDEDDDEGRIQELLDEAEDLQAEAAVDSKKSPAKVNGTAAGSKKRPLAADVMEEDEEDDEPAVDVSMASAADSVDTSKLSKNQRKKLAKKLKAANGEAVPAPVAAASDKKAAPAAKATEAAATKKSAPAAAAGAAVTLPSGLKYVDSKPGSGPACKPGQKVSMRYIGKLASNGKTFDKNTAGAPFRFQLGKGEVIKGARPFPLLPQVARLLMSTALSRVGRRRQGHGGRRRTQADGPRGTRYVTTFSRFLLLT